MPSLRSARALPALLALLALPAPLASCAAADPPPPCAPTAASPAPIAPAPSGAPSALPEQLFASASLTPTFADPDRRKKLEASLAGLDAIVAAEVKRQGAPGMAVGVVIDGELAWSKGFGLTDLTGTSAPDADTIYRIGSISKSFVGLTVLALRDDGALSLDDALVKHFPEASALVYPTKDAAPITLRQLLTHRSGLPRDLDVTPDVNPTEADLARALRGYALQAAPGARFSYSNAGFGLLGIAASRAAKRPFRELVAKRLLEPLGMTSTAWDDAALPAARIATAYAKDPKGQPLKTERLRLGAEEPSGGLYSSVRDMARYVAFQLAAYPPRDAPDAGSIHRATVREAHSTGVRSSIDVSPISEPKKGEPSVRLSDQAYGTGWVQEQTCDFDDLVWHNGAIDGYTADLRFLPSRGVGVVTLANFFGAAPAAVSQKVVRALFEGGGLSRRMLPVSPQLDAAMKKLLAVQNTWDEAAYKAMLAAGRKAFPREREELAGYEALHGACATFTPMEVRSAYDARFSVKCERGTFEMTLVVSSADGGIQGFTGKSLDVDAPKPLRVVADHLASLVGKWDDKLYTRHIAPMATRKKDDTQAWFADVLRRAHGSCKVKSAFHEGYDTSFILECERGGDMTLGLSLDEKKPDALTGYWFRPVGQGGVCPTR